MRIEVSGRRLELTDAITQYATEKCQKLPKYFNGVSEIEVVLDQAERGEFDVEIVADVVRHENFVSHARGEELYACIDQAVEKMTRQLTDHKSKLREVRD